MSEKVYTGAWVNWSKGNVLGSTVTIPVYQGAFLIAFVALFVRWAGSHLFQIYCFVLHQWRSTSADQDGLYHQQQAVLRNGDRDAAVLWNLLKLNWFWKTQTHAVFRRCIPLIVIAVSHMIIFAVCGIFSSRVTTTADEVLVRSSRCGFFDDRVPTGTYTAEDWDLLDSQFVMTHFSLQKSYAYSRSCYGTDPNAYSSQCKTFAERAIVSTIDESAPCPFEAQACERAAFKIDSGYIDSDYHLGLNAPPGDRMGLRRTTTCAPLNSEQYATEEFEPGPNELLSDNLPENSYRYWYMGADLINQRNFTFYISNYSFYETTEPYTLNGFTSFALNQTENDFTPIQDFAHDDADVTLLLLKNNIRYTTEVKDPWFSASKEYNNRDLGLSLDGSSWLPTTYASMIGCTEQYQLCTSKDQCTEPSGYYGINPSLDLGLKMNANQKATAKLLYTALHQARMQYLVWFLRAQLLVAQEHLYGHNFISSALQPNQWQVEVSNIQNVSLSMLQRKVVEYASPPVVEIRPGTSSINYLVEPADDVGEICGNVKVRNAAYSSFSVLGLSVIFGVGVFIILINCWLSNIVGWMQRKFGKGEYQRIEWMESETLQLQRMAFEGRGIGPWKGQDAPVPVFEKFAQKFPMPSPWAASAVQQAAPIVSSTDVKGGNPQLNVQYSSVPLQAPTPMSPSPLSPPPQYAGQNQFSYFPPSAQNMH